AGARGRPAPTVQWQVSTDGGATFNDISGATSPSLTFSAVAADDAKQYRARFSNLCAANVPSTAAILTLDSGPLVTLNPASQTVCPGSVTFTAGASGSPAPTVQWQVSTDGGATFNDISGATSPSLTFSAVAADDARQYRARFSNLCAANVPSTAAILTLDSGPLVTLNPASQTVCPGSVTFTAGASGSPAPTVQWQVSTDGGATFNDISGATSPSLTFSAVAADDARQYRARFSNLCAANVPSTAAILTLDSGPLVTLNPASQTVCPGSVTFTAGASGSPAPTVQWQVSTDGGATFNDISGATSPSLTFSAVAADDAKQYRARFSNLCAANVPSTAAILTLDSGPLVTLNPASQTVCPGSVTFTAGASGSPAPTVQWQVSTDGGATFNDIPGATSPSLTFSAVAADDAKQYRARFSNVCAANVASTAAILTLDSGPVVTLNPSSQTVCAGSVTFTATASGSPAPTVQWQVSTDGGATFNDIPGATSSSLTFGAVAADDGKQYRARF